jgi:hypothetical protein
MAQQTRIMDPLNLLEELIGCALSYPKLIIGVNMVNFVDLVG